MTDAPVDNHGLGRNFSPTDLVAVALGTCILTTMAIVARRHGVELTGSVSRLAKEMSTTPPRRIAKLTAHFTLATPAPLTDELRHRLEEAGRRCPVHQSLSHDIALDLAFAWSTSTP